MISRQALQNDIDNLERVLRILIHRAGGGVTLTPEDYHTAPLHLRSHLDHDTITLTTEGS